MTSPPLEIWSPENESSSILRSNEVHVWRFELDEKEERIESLSELLSSDERARKDRYLFDRDRRRFVVCRAKQRKILSRYVAQAADELQFRYSGLGKPSIEPPKGQTAIHFSLSNSMEMGLCAVACHATLGVDVEKFRDLNDMLGLAKRFFAASEVAELNQCDGHQQTEAFFAIWTCKEAILKAVGKGLSYPLNEVAISRPPRQIARFGDDSDQTRRSWGLQTLAPASGYTAALAGQFPISQVHLWDFDR